MFSLFQSVRRYVTAGPGSQSRRVAVPPGILVSVGAGSLADNPGARTRRKRVGRGGGGGKGKTAGRGHKGFHARAAKSRPVPGFEGGQAGILRAVPKLGFRPPTARVLAPLRLDALQHWIDARRLDPARPIGIRELVAARCVGGGAKDGVVVLAKGGHFLRSAVDLRVTHASQRAIQLIEEKGGKVTCFDYDRSTIRALLNPAKFIGEPTPSVINKSIPARYFDSAKRGYLADQVDKLMDRVKKYKETN
ncbi:ribosomal protein L18e/L15P [Obelidium mucronatum]|nr:ribosomal protein L18e/L15P [Obelidium mucronatum]